MKLHHLLFVAVTVLALPGCPEKSVSDRVEDNVDDALDRRPGEKIRDTAEDAEDAVKDAAEDAKDTVNDATD